ncbi:MAG: TetR/AcrR family transcriptional regulator [Planctomycetes bacterium]|nr:TetR/AcrR family transcriptional regulator [Planctomycetota bacterium]
MPKAPRADTRTRILDAALDLFHAQGVAATGLDQILTASGAGKGQLYHFFADKDELVLEAMRHHRSQLASGAIPLKRDLRTWKDLEEWFAFFLGAQRSMQCARSCPIGTIAGELTAKEGPLRDEARAIFDEAREPLRHLFAALRDAGKLRASVDPRELADFCYVVMQGGMLVGKVERSPLPFENAVRQALQHVRSLRA